MQTVKVIVGAGVVLELTAGWLDLQQAEPDAVYLLPVRYRRIGLGRHYLVPVGERVGSLAVEVTLKRQQERKARR